MLELIAFLGPAKVDFKYDLDIERLLTIALPGVRSVPPHRTETTDPNYVHESGLQPLTIASLTLTASFICATS